MNRTRANSPTENRIRHVVNVRHEQPRCVSGQASGSVAHPLTVAPGTQKFPHPEPVPTKFSLTYTQQAHTSTSCPTHRGPPSPSKLSSPNLVHHAPGRDHTHPSQRHIHSLASPYPHQGSRHKNVTSPPISTAVYQTWMRRAYAKIHRRMILRT